jgi:hypothetical protein
MALTLQDPNLVWQKVNKALGVQTAGTALTAASAASQNVFKALKTQMATQQLNQTLQFVPFSYANLTGASGYQPGIATAFHLYGLWAKKTGTGTTGAFLNVYDNATPSGAKLRDASFLVTGATGVGGDEVAKAFPLGIAFATDLTFISATTSTGGTAITGAGDIINGFAIIGA